MERFDGRAIKSPLAWALGLFIWSDGTLAKKGY